MDIKKINLGKDLAKTLKKYFIIIIAFAVICAGVTKKIKTKDYVQQYEAMAKVAVFLDPETKETMAQYDTNLIKYNSILALSSQNLKLVSEDIDVPLKELESIRNNWPSTEGSIVSGQLNAVCDANVIVIEYTSSDKDKTVALVNSVAENLVKLNKQTKGYPVLKIIDKTDTAQKMGEMSIGKDVQASGIAGFIAAWVIMLFFDLSIKNRKKRKK